MTVESAVPRPLQCDGCGDERGMWSYVEIRVEHEETNISGRIDGLFVHGDEKIIVDIKTVENPSAMRRIVSPRPSDVAQINMYQLATGIDHAAVVYVPRTISSSDMPSSVVDDVSGVSENMIKVVDVPRDDDNAWKYLDRVRKFREHAVRIAEELENREFSSAQERDFFILEQLPACPFGGIGPYGPCACTQL